MHGWLSVSVCPVVIDCSQSLLPLIAVQPSQALYHPSRHPRYDGPLKYLTMWTCLILSPAACDVLQELQGYDANWGALKDIRMNMSVAQPIHPHPLDVLLELLHAGPKQGMGGHDRCVSL